MNKPLPNVFLKIEERAYYDKFARQLIRHFQANIDKIYSSIKQGELKEVRRGFSHRIQLDSYGRVSRIIIEHSKRGLFVDLGVGRGLKLDDIGYQKIGRTLLGRKVNNRRAGRWYLKTAYGQTIRLMDLVAKQRGDQYTVLVNQYLKSIGNITVNI